MIMRISQQMRNKFYDKKSKLHLLYYHRILNKIKETPEQYYKTIEKLENEAQEQLDLVSDFQTRSKIDTAVREMKKNKAYFVIEQAE